MGREDEETRDGGHESVSHRVLICCYRSQEDVSMADGLGLNDDEWEELRAQVDDSFWVMRIIGG